MAAARAVFADKGSDAQIDDVARRAKVGVGTVYRHFPTKETLVDAVVREGFEVIAGYAREALERDDAWEAFVDLIWRSARHNADDRGFREAIAMSDRRDVAADCGLQGVTQLIVDRAREQGATVLEGHPVDPAVRGATVSSADLYHGVFSMFVAAGFAEVGRTAPSRPVVRLALR